jgi:fatty acid desaturase
MNKQPESSRSCATSIAQTQSDKRFYLEARELVQDLFKPDEKLYWIDFTLSVIAAYVFASIYLANPLTWVSSWLCLAISSVLIYRASMFIHEIVHMPHDSMKGFRLYWNIIAGIPMMVPSFTYESHVHHHSSRHYGTGNDGEYLPLARGTVFNILMFMAQIFFQPILVFCRYLIGTPLSFLHPKLRRWFYMHATSLVINFRYQKEIKDDTFKTSNTILEILCSVRVWAMVLLVVAGITPGVRIPKMLLIAVTVLALNHIRTLVAHRYRSDGHKVSHLDQFLDSTNITGSWLTELICPCGLRYHALHHLFPGIPYHNLGAAHRRLVSNLPADSPYHENVYPSFWPVFKELWTSVRENGGVLRHHH